MPTEALERKPIVILMAEDDGDDQLLAKLALERSRLLNELHIVPDGVELLAYLRREGEYADAPEPGLILLDLNMPRKDGREALAEMKQDPALRQIPVVVLTSSREERDIIQSYNLGANSYIIKPVSFAGLVEVMHELGRYWFEIVEIPASEQDVERER